MINKNKLKNLLSESIVNEYVDALEDSPDSIIDNDDNFVLPSDEQNDWYTGDKEEDTEFVLGEELPEIEEDYSEVTAHTNDGRDININKYRMFSKKPKEPTHFSKTRKKNVGDTRNKYFSELTSQYK